MRGFVFIPRGHSAESAMHSESTREALRATAGLLASRVESIGTSEGVDMNVSVSEGVRPKGRPYARVGSPREDVEWGSRYVKRRRVLGRAVEEMR